MLRDNSGLYLFKNGTVLAFYSMFYRILTFNQSNWREFFVLKWTKILILSACLCAVAGSSMALPQINQWISYNHGVAWDYDNYVYDYVSDVDFSTHRIGLGPLDGYTIGTQAGLDHSLSWSHTLPGDLTVPPGSIERALLWIDGSRIDDNDNWVSFQGVFQWGGLNSNDGPWWDFLGLLGDNTLVNLTDVNIPGFWNQGSLDVSISAGERSLRINNASLALSYTAGTNPTTPGVPEPATMLLFGLGLVGAGIARRIRK